MLGTFLLSTDIEAGYVTSTNLILQSHSVENYNNMPNCTICNSRYQLSPYNNTDTCDFCIDSNFDTFEDTQYEINSLLNPTGKTQPVFYDNTDADSI